MTDNNYPIKAKVWLRESTQEWVLELDGTINDTSFNIRYTEPSTTRPEDVPAAPLDRIEKLENSLAWYQMMDAMCSDHVVELTEKLEAAEAKLTECEARLSKAVELALEECPFRAGTPKYDKWWHHRRDVLAELEGRE